MGTSLTGTKPKDTYDSLIKVGDNGPISGTAKYLSDGLGNDLPIAVSTSNVGIGTSLPAFRLDAVAAEAGTYTTSTQQVVARLYNNPSNLGSGVNSSFLSLQTTTDGGNANPTARIGVVAESYGSNNGAFVVTTRDGSGNIEKMRVTSDGYLRLATGGIQFNGDTAAANALDDYEEGTWTMGITFGGASVGVTYSANTGTYTKVGRKVTANGFLALSSKGSSSGTARITGLPFTIASGDSNYSAPSVWLNRITFANQFQAYGNTNATTIDLSEITSLGVLSFLTEADFANNSEIMISFTYFV